MTLLGPVTFWWFPDEEQQLIDHLTSTGVDRVWVGDRAQTREALVLRSLDSAIRAEPREILISLPEHENDVIVNELKDREQAVHVVDLLRSPLLSYKRGGLIAPKELASNNIVGYADYLDGSRTIQKPESFVRWAKNVLAFVRRATPQSHRYKSYRISTRVAEAIANDGLEIVP